MTGLSRYKTISIIVFTLFLAVFAASKNETGSVILTPPVFFALFYYTDFLLKKILLKIISAGQKLVNEDWIRLKPTKAVSKNQ